ncbi:hypothetical protein PoB_003303400 [Plakobranchus ocellatus]|uniref:Uncharacterized protein n=1 Tax=Plakobranchus ocellatus TaxID=259542 RepID=A0AAV4AFS9_9GAST|nr:hypothetical protein PoB_003303400 [Plakobranchus ocellatus]
MCTANPQHGDLRHSTSPSGLGAGGGPRTRERKGSEDLRTGSLSTVPPTPLVLTMVIIIDLKGSFCRGFEPRYWRPDLTEGPKA